jgi:two-component system sensor kinase FixL
MGIVAGMVLSENISEVLQSSSLDNMLLLADERGSQFRCPDFSLRMRPWFEERIEHEGVRGFFDGRERAFRAGPYAVVWTPANVPGGEKWYLAMLYDEDRYLHGHAWSLWEGWGTAAVVLVLGGAVMLLCRAAALLSVARQRAETHSRALAESDQRHRAIVDHAAEGIVTIDEEGIIDSFNAAAERIFGYTANQVIGKNVRMLIPAPHNEHHDGYVSRYVKTGEPRMDGIAHEVEGLRADGTTVPLEITVSEVRLPKRRLFTGIVRDISERRRAEEQARQHHSELLHVARVATLGEIATSLAHELNQPLYAIVNYIRACMERIRSNTRDPRELLEPLERAADQAQRAGQIIERARHFIVKREPHRAAVDINALVRQAADLMMPEVRRLHAHVRLQLADACLRVTVDPVQIEQVLVNMIRNALEAMAEAQALTRQITLRTEMTGDDTLRCEIQDTGPGMSESVLERAFDPFFTTRPDGLGMGLAICRTIIEANGGRLWATADPGHGATFFFTLAISKGTTA